MKSNILNIFCETCGAGLMDILPLDPEADLEYTFVVHCAHCGNKNDPQEFYGQIQFASTQESDIIAIVPNEEENVVHFYTKLVKGVK